MLRVSLESVLPVYLTSEAVCCLQLFLYITVISECITWEFSREERC